MAPALYNVRFGILFSEDDIKDIPDNSGVYCIFASPKNRQIGQFSLGFPIYIGESAEMKTRIGNHFADEVLLDSLKPNEKLLVSTSRVISLQDGESDEDARARVEAVLVYRLQPTFNKKFKKQFRFESSIVSVEGPGVLNGNFSAP